MNKDPFLFIQHILESIKSIESFMESIKKNGFMKNKEKQSAVVHQIEIIGEAAKNISNEFTNRYPSIHWSDIIRTRDKMIHNYFAIDLDIVWDIVKRDLPKLKEALHKIISEEK